MVRICFVCLGNICRSPTAEGVMTRLVERAGLTDEIAIDSAGTGAWHVGELADERARQTARERGITLTSRARRFSREDFRSFDYVIAMDQENYDDLSMLSPEGNAAAKLRLLRSFDPAAPRGAEVPDPYYGGPRGFDDVFDICEAACKGLLAHIREVHGL